VMAKPPLDVGYGYGIVLGLGFLFAFGGYLHKPDLQNQPRFLTIIYCLRNDVDNLDSEEVC
jgi:hypothetical protein